METDNKGERERVNDEERGSEGWRERGRGMEREGWGEIELLV